MLIDGYTVLLHTIVFSNFISYYHQLGLYIQPKIIFTICTYNKNVQIVNIVFVSTCYIRIYYTLLITITNWDYKYN